MDVLTLQKYIELEAEWVFVAYYVFSRYRLLFGCCLQSTFWAKLKSGLSTQNKLFVSSWFQTFAVFWMLYAFFWVIPRLLIQTPGNHTTFRLFLVSAGRDSSVGIATSYGLDGPGIESRLEATFSAPVHTGPGAHPTSYKTGTGSFRGGGGGEGGKAAGAWRWPPTPSIAEVKERVELYLYSHCVPSWNVVGWTSFSQPGKVCSEEIHI